MSLWGKDMPSPGGQVSGKQAPKSGAVGGWGGRVRHPVDLPEGLPHGGPTAALDHEGARGSREPPPGRRAVGLRQVDGKPHESQRPRASKQPVQIG